MPFFLNMYVFLYFKSDMDLFFLDGWINNIFLDPNQVSIYQNLRFWDFLFTYIFMAEHLGHTRTKSSKTSTMFITK